jgi:hypothetical protein
MYQHKSVLVASTPFTGKTSLSQLLHDSLLKIDKVNSYLITFSDFRPTIKGFYQFLKEQTNIDFTSESPFAKQDYYLIFDEFQQTYPSTKEEIVSAFFRSELHSKINSERMSDRKNSGRRSRIVSTPETRAMDIILKDYGKVINQLYYDLLSFHGFMKRSFSRTNVNFVCFSSYGDQKSDAQCSTPYNFGARMDSYAYFTDSEINELLQDFLNRSQIKFSDEKESINLLKKFLQELTSFHVGFVASILGHINKFPNIIYSFDTLFKYLYSPKIVRLISTERASPSTFELSLLTNEQKLDLLKLLEYRSLALESSCFYLQFVKSGWLKLDYNTKNVSFPCILSEDVFYMEYYGLVRPKNDEFNNLNEFMLKYLASLPQQFFQKTFSSAKDRPEDILEIFFCHEFYRIAYTFLRQDTFVHGQAQQIEDIGIDGKVDFVIKNGDRCWVVEFLILGDTKIGSQLTNAEDHMNRFKTKYGAFAKYDYLVVDFRPGKGAKFERISIGLFIMIQQVIIN